MLVLFCTGMYFLIGLLAGIGLCYCISRYSSEYNTSIPVGLFTFLLWPVVLPIAGVIFIMGKVYQKGLKDRNIIKDV